MNSAQQETLQRSKIPSVLFVDDEAPILDAHRRLMQSTHYDTYYALSGDEALEYMESHHVDVVISDMRMPIMSGAVFLSKVRQTYPETMRILLTGFSDLDATIEAINEGCIYRYLTKPWSNEELKAVIQEALEIKLLRLEKDALLKIANEQNETLVSLNKSLEEKVAQRTQKLKKAADCLQSLNTQLKTSNQQVIEAFSALIENFTGESVGDNKKRALIVKTLCERLDLPTHECEQTFYAALLHDIGLIGLPKEVIASPRYRLKDGALKMYQKHSELAQSALISIDQFEKAGEILFYHHEYWDGSGFPEGLYKERIPFGSRVLCVVNDYFDLLRGFLSSRSFEKTAALDHLLSKAGVLYDANVVHAFHLLMTTEMVDESLVRFNLVAIADLQPGMVLGEDLITPSKVLLLREGTELTSGVINRLFGHSGLQKSMTVSITTEGPSSDMKR